MKVKHKSCAVIIKDKKFLVVRNVGRSIWTSPGGHVENGETADQSVKRELGEELGFIPSKVEPYGEIETKSPIEKDVVMKLSFFIVHPNREFKITDPEIGELMWVDSKYKGEDGELIDSLKGWLTERLLKDGLIN
ncbi:MAG: NUDIX domain-containing protein [Candidatus Marsarchaeota archaeon]|nr:NUDIX domain-containing protein [Candidatus Marsarchaeota archaeon]